MVIAKLLELGRDLRSLLDNGTQTLLCLVLLKALNMLGPNTWSVCFKAKVTDGRGVRAGGGPRTRG
jgi:hypothetical protein